LGILSHGRRVVFLVRIPSPKLLLGACFRLVQRISVLSERGITGTSDDFRSDRHRPRRQVKVLDLLVLVDYGVVYEHLGNTRAC